MLIGRLDEEELEDCSVSILGKDAMDFVIADFFKDITKSCAHASRLFLFSDSIYKLINRKRRCSAGFIEVSAGLNKDGFTRRISSVNALIEGSTNGFLDLYQSVQLLSVLEVIGQQNYSVILNSVIYSLLQKIYPSRNKMGGRLMIVSFPYFK